MESDYAGAVSATIPFNTAGLFHSRVAAAPARYLQVCPREERRIDENSSSSSLGRLGQRLACDRGPGLWTSAVNNLSELGTADTFASFNRQATVA